MFDIGFSEIFVIAVVALIVLGPEKLPKAARFAGLWVRKARAQWYAVKSEFENDLAADELKRSLAETRESLRQAQEDLRAGVTGFRDRVQGEFDEVAAAATAAVTPGVEPGSTPAPDAAAQPNRHAHEEEERSMESASAMDWEPPIPSDDDDGEPVEPDEDASPHTPPKHADDAHAGR